MKWSNGQAMNRLGTARNILLSQNKTLQTCNNVCLSLPFAPMLSLLTLKNVLDFESMTFFHSFSFSYQFDRESGEKLFKLIVRVV